LSKKELARSGVLARVKAGGLLLKDGAVLMRVGERQAKRLWKSYRTGGAASLKHGNAGRTSNRARPAKERQKILRKVEEKYNGFGPTLAAEHLASEDGLAVHPETLRRWMLSTGQWVKARKRGGKVCLMNMVDDATSTVEALLDEGETIWAAARVLRQWIAKYGVPLALYTDWKSVYLREPTEKELLRGKVPVTQFGRMCEKLDIRIIAANSPQAKGRVERGNSTHQDRLIKKMGRKKIRTHEAANRFLQEEYLEGHNARFARPPARPEDYHRRAPNTRELEQVFCLETERSVSNDWVVRYENRYFQLERTSDYPPRQAKVMVCEWEDERIEIRYKGKARPHREIEAPQPVTQPLPRVRPPQLSRWKPPADHPWKTPAPLGRPPSRSPESIRPAAAAVKALR
jgi:hypothetical protein